MKTTLAETLLVCDLDGTLLDAKGAIDQKSLAKIKQYCLDGGNFVICTGRMDTDIQYIEEKLGFKGKFRISQNGAVIYNEKDQLIQFKTIPKKFIAVLNQIIFGMGLRTEVSNKSNRLFPSPRKPEEVAEFVDSSIVIEQLPDYLLQNKNQVTIYLTFGGSEDFSKIKEAIDQQLGPDQVNVVETSPKSLEVFSKEVSKGLAVREIMQRLNIKKEQTYVVGDAPSDTTMFAYAGHAFAVQEAKAEIIRQAGNYCQTVGEVVEKIYLNQEVE